MRGAGLGEPRTRVASQPCRRTYKRSRMSTVDVCWLGPDGDACAVRVSPSCSMDTCRRACRAPDPTPLWKVCRVWCCVDDDVSAIRPPAPRLPYVYDVIVRVQHEIGVQPRCECNPIIKQWCDGRGCACATRRTWPRVSRPPWQGHARPVAYVPAASLRCCVRTFIPSYGIGRVLSTCVDRGERSRSFGVVSAGGPRRN